MFKKYDAYKDSGVEWLGPLPNSWELLSNKYIFKLKKDLVGKKSKDYELLSLTLNGVIKRDMENPEGKFPAEFDTYQKVNVGDFIFCHFDVEETPRTVGLSTFNGMITGAYTVYEVDKNFFDSKFLYYFYLNLDVGKRLKPLYKGLRNTIGKDVFGNFETFIPTKDEQNEIVKFLDQKTSEIDQAIALKEQQISLLNERKQIVIQKAVTQGLNPNVPMKDSGVEWIGQIPEHWDCKPSRYVFRAVKRFKRDGTEIKFSVTQKWGVIPTDEMKESSTQAESFNGFQICLEDDLVLNKYKAHLGVFWRAPSRGLITGNYTVFEPLKDISSKYFELLYHTSVYIDIFRTIVYGIVEGMMPLYNNDFYDMQSIVPPFNEQLDIVKFVENEQRKFSSIENVYLSQIEKLKEYKITLINDAVTGKIKVI
ncbi:Type I restriction modification DNA specificity domain protein [Acinetobacter venetianus]|uniref:Type I restriction modification DNA specificity domain protein n=1 Tax=Acinetobacter venetianus TaxID=52133 RepID=A0A150HJR9_9GAMM|nr:restriction endonuclease subunit S [Acinetobacter venetianus]KXZ63614.1 Type I restriction modification DNA specificity domain protein [Acinetobacter venetianus]